VKTGEKLEGVKCGNARLDTMIHDTMIHDTMIHDRQAEMKQPQKK